MIKQIKRKDGIRHQVYSRKGGKKVYVGSYDSRRAAQDAEEEYRVTQRKIDAGELAADLDLKRTFATAAEEWLASLKSQGSRSHAIYRGRMDRHILPVLGSTSLARITTTNIIRWRDGLSRLVAAPTVNSTIGTLSSAFKFFRSMQWVLLNPCKDVARLKEEGHDFEWLRSGEQITRLLVACHPTIRPIVALMIGTGLRIDEALHLTWDDIDIDHRLIQVRRGRQGTTKSGKSRPVPIFDSVLPLLRHLKLARGSNFLVFPNDKGRPRSKPGIFRPFKNALASAGLPLRIRPHDLRHSFAILYLLDGGDLHRLSRILGHSTVLTTEKCYLRFKPVGFELDYGRVRFALPTEDRAPIALVR